MLKMSLGLVSGAALVMMLTYGCSSSESTPAAATDAGGGGGDSSTTKKDSGSGTDSGGGTTCAPGDVSSFAPTFKKPAAFDQKICTNTQVEALLCLFDSKADQTTCEAAIQEKANEDCFKCIYTDKGAKDLGPIVIDGSIGSLNLAGCVANATGDTTDKSCGAKIQAADQCGDAACNDNCPVPDDDDGTALDERNACNEKAATGVCSDFTDAAACADDLLKAGGTAEKCVTGQDFLARAKNLAKLFCAGGTGGDGGTDAPADAPADGG